MKTTLDFDEISKLCALALVEPPPAHYRHSPTLLLLKKRQAQAKLKRWERARNRTPDFKELQAGINQERD